MGKFKKALKNKEASSQLRRNPYDLVEPDQSREPRKRNGKHLDDEMPASQHVENKMAARVFSQAQRQLKEEEGKTAGGDDVKRDYQLPGAEDQLDAEEFEDLNPDEYDEKAVEVDPKDEEDLRRFMTQNVEKKQTLWEMIQDRIGQKEVDADGELDMPEDIEIRSLEPEVVDVYQQVGQVLAKYRSGKLPKAFKYICSMENWEQLLYLTEPDNWSAASIYQATVIFSSNLNPASCQRFYHHVLLPRLRDDIDEYKKLSFPLYQALVKSLYKPGAFFKGLIMPLCESGTCTLREAIIFCSIIQKFTIPIFHSAAALIMIAEMEYSGANSLFLRTLIDKKYALPLRCIKVLVDHFARFKSNTEPLPVLWHQSLLSFVQRYKLDLTEAQKKDIYSLVQAQFHYMITPEIRRELQHSTAVPRTAVVAEEASSGVRVVDAKPRGNDTMEF
ncbi:unnamed protein product, partial [Mesorhabditis spiculigera]